MYFFINFLISTEIFLIISFFSNIVNTIIVVAVLVVLISLFYLYFNKIGKNVDNQLQLLHKNAVFSQVTTPSLHFNIKSNFTLQ